MSPVWAEKPPNLTAFFTQHLVIAPHSDLETTCITTNLVSNGTKVVNEFKCFNGDHAALANFTIQKAWWSNKKANTELFRP